MIDRLDQPAGPIVLRHGDRGCQIEHAPERAMITPELLGDAHSSAVRLALTVEGVNGSVDYAIESWDSMARAFIVRRTGSTGEVPR